MMIPATAPLPSRVGAGTLPAPNRDREGAVVAANLCRLGAIIILAAARILFAQDALQVLQKTGDFYKSAHSYSLEGADTLEQVSPGGKRVTARPFHAYKLDAAMRVDFADGGIRLTDGKSEWNYNPRTKEYARKAVPWDRRGLRVLHEFFYNYDGIADFVKRAEFISAPGPDGFLIEVTYELPGGVAAESVKNFWIDANFTVRRETSYPRAFESRARLTRTITFEKTSFHPALDPALFTPPPEKSAAGPAPDFTLPDLAGASCSLKELRGSVVLLYFWATWCATCRAEMPRLEKLARDYRDRGVVLLGVNDEDPAISSEYLEKGGHALRSLVDRWQDVFKQYRISQIPAVIVIGRDGRILPGLKEAGIE